MAKLVLLAVCIAAAGVLAEPPPSSYLPPQARNQQPSSRYGAPNGRFGSQQRSAGGSRSFSYNSLHENQFSGSSQRRNGQASQASQSRSRSFGQQPAQQYNAPSNNGYSNGAAQQYNRPNQGYSSPSQQYGAPSQQPSSQYGAPAPRYQAPSTEYGAPFGRKMDDDLAEPANYEYNYEVQAGEEGGAEFGHQESREDDAARGEYHVLLPDGRMQIVEYEADEEGFRPRIRYEETGLYPDARNGQDNQGPY